MKTRREWKNEQKWVDLVEGVRERCVDSDGRKFSKRALKKRLVLGMVLVVNVEHQAEIQRRIGLMGTMCQSFTSPWMYSISVQLCEVLCGDGEEPLHPYHRGRRFRSFINFFFFFHKDWA